MRGRFRAFVCILMCAAAVAGLSSCAALTQGDAAAMPQSNTRLLCLNVGKADCMLLFIAGKTFLIDAGWERTYGALAEALRQCGVTRLDGVFLTHCHEDHYGGLGYLAQSDIPVGAWYASPQYFDVKASRHPLVLAAALRGDAVTWLDPGDVIDLPGGASITALGPLRLNTTNENNNSLVLFAQSEDGSLLLAADMKTEQENDLLAAGVIPFADVLKVGHHGDGGATGDALLQAVEPDAAIISTSTREELDTPSSAVIKRLQRGGAQVAVTQDFADGVWVCLKYGQPTIENADWRLPDYSRDVTVKLTLTEDLLTIRNASGAAIDLSGWIVYSSRGEDCYMLPEGAMLPANGVYKLGSGVTRVDYHHNISEKRVWNDTRYDRAMLYDGAGHVVAVTDNGLPE